ncbi:NarK/NasA family nitrate transporter [Leptospira fletcheri]|uniref:NarK/NasA family nitrate transporter n=1 Tax=Leptospira fletcheri TaxID=2484981 RepID=A0A4R9GJY4_9LEPT|nr:MFS transporter [Leptospira fletcheri]TGK14052.1 NarK/NasA family nitrate transporter [Leptospira fletcheri]
MKKMQEFLKAGHFPTLISSFLYFDCSFMIWMLLAALGVFLSEEFSLGPAQKGFIVSIPLLGGTLMRIPLGILSDRFGSKKVALWGMTISMIPLFWGWRFAGTLSEVACIGLLLGIAGASFAVALPLASRWYPAKYQGLVLGIAGAGNSGSVLATLFAPALAKNFGWHAVFGLAMIPMACVFLFFLLTAKDCPGSISKKSLKEYLAPIKSRDALTFCILYSITFGGFVGIASFLPIFFYDQYGIGKLTTGLYTSYCILGASLLRPLGGYLSDKFGGVLMITIVLLFLTTVLIGISFLPPVALVLPLFILLMASLGIGNGSVFQLVPLRFKKDIGVVTGFVGAFGGLGGFLIPNLLGSLKSLTGSFSFGFLAVAIASLSACALVFFMNALVWKNSDSTESDLEMEAT